MERYFPCMCDIKTDDTCFKWILRRHNVNPRKSPSETPCIKSIEPARARIGWIYSHVFSNLYRSVSVISYGKHDDIQVPETLCIRGSTFLHLTAVLQHRPIRAEHEHVHRVVRSTNHRSIIASEEKFRECSFARAP